MTVLSNIITPSNVLTTTNTATVTNKTFGDNPTFSGGTANGVTFLNGSKVLTSGSALKFDGTNLGLGVTPNTMFSTVLAMQIGQGAILEGRTNGPNMSIGANFYLDSSAVYRYPYTDFASRYTQATGQHLWFTAASGTAGNAITFTQAMTLDVSGNLGVGTTSPSFRLHAVSSAAVVSRIGSSGGSGAFINFIDSGASPTVAPSVGAIGNNLVFMGDGSSSERARIDSSGNLLVGGTAARATTVGTAHLDLFNGTAPAGTLTNGVSLYSSSGDLKFMNAAGTDFDVGYRNIPQNSQSAAYTLVLADAGKHIFHPVGDNNARTFTIPANSSVAYPIGTAITFINMAVANVTIAITTDTLTLSPAGTTGSRTLATNGSATCIKITSTTWLISGSGLT